METAPIKVLLVEDSPADARLVMESLNQAKQLRCEVIHARSLAEAVQRLTEADFQLMVLDLGLPDSRGLETFRVARRCAPEVPLLVLTALDDERVGLRAIREGAQDFLVKGDAGLQSLVRSVQYALARHQTQGLLRAASLTDELTGLYNRRGFLILAEQQLRVAERTKACLTLLFADVDGLRHINETLGQEQGDLVLLEAAELLRTTFRKSDIVARIGGDEFIVLILDIPSQAVEGLMVRLEHTIRSRNQRPSRLYQLSLSLGTAVYDPGQPCSLTELIGRADAAMYSNKQRRRQPVSVSQPSQPV